MSNKLPDLGSLFWALLLLWVESECAKLTAPVGSVTIPKTLTQEVQRWAGSLNSSRRSSHSFLIF